MLAKSPQKGSWAQSKHVQAFNQPIVEHHFKSLKLLFIKQGIPQENIYNEDEKGIQLGGEEEPPPCYVL